MRLLSTTSRLAILCAVPFAGMLAANTGALAQSGTVETVVVTATKTAQNVQRVPIAISAFTASALEDRSVLDVSQISNLTPNVTLDAGTPFSGSGSVLAAYIRGIGQNDFAFNQDPGVGVYLDGVYLARSVGSNTDLLDIERIEVLKGPQGTLFGRNTIGGAISIITRDPGSEPAFTGSVTGGSFSRLDAKGIFDIPLAENLRTSLSFSHKQRDGFVKRVPFPTQGPLHQQAIEIDGTFSVPLSTPVVGPILAPLVLPNAAPYTLNSADCPTFPDCPTISDGATRFPAAGYQTSERESGENQWSARFKAIWDVNEDLRLTLAADYTFVDEPAQGNAVLEIDPDFPLPSVGAFGQLYNNCIGQDQTTLLTGFFGGPQPYANICGPRGIPPGTLVNATNGNQFYSMVGTALASVNADGVETNNRYFYGPWFQHPDKDTTYATGNSFSKLYQWGVSGTVDLDIAENLHVKNILAFRRLHWKSGMDLDGSPLDFLEPSFDMPQHELSEELQVTGSLWDEVVSYVIGGYYFHEQGHLHDFVTFAEGFLMIDGMNDLETDAWATYFSVNLKLGSYVTLVLGGRYTDEHKEFEGHQHDLNGINYKGGDFNKGLGSCIGAYPGSPGYPFTSPPPADPTISGPGSCQEYERFPDPTDPLRYFPPGVNVKDFSNFSPNIGLQIQATEDMMLYFTYSEGFKSGSWTTRLSSPNPTFNAALEFDPEKAKSYELGVKSEWFENRARLNIAGFMTDYEGIQLSFQEGPSPTLRNAGTATIWGAEAELEALLMDGLTLNASLGYINAEYDTIDPRVLKADGVTHLTKNDMLPKTPEWKFNIGPQYVFPFSNGSSVFVTADWTYTSEMANDTDNTPLLMRPDTNVINASIGYSSPERTWEFVVGGTNIGDERFLTNGQNQPAISVIYGTYNRPAEYYATLRIKL